MGCVTSISVDVAPLPPPNPHSKLSPPPIFSLAPTAPPSVENSPPSSASGDQSPGSPIVYVMAQRHGESVGSPEDVLTDLKEFADRSFRPILGGDWEEEDDETQGRLTDDGV